MLWSPRMGRSLKGLSLEGPQEALEETDSVGLTLLWTADTQHPGWDSEVEVGGECSLGFPKTVTQCSVEAKRNPFLPSFLYSVSPEE